jgi:hypothetical protein
MACMYRDLAQGRRAPNANILQRLGTSARGPYSPLYPHAGPSHMVTFTHTGARQQRMVFNVP